MAEPDAVTPALRVAGRATIELGAVLDLPDAATGAQRMTPILGGQIRGPLLDGEILPGGADWQVVHGDGTVSIDARYPVRLRDGLGIIHSVGVRTKPAAAVPYFRVALRITAAPERTDLNHRLFLATGVREMTRVILDIFEVG